MMSPLLLLVLRVTLLSALAWAAVRLLRRSHPSDRHRVALTAIVLHWLLVAATWLPGVELAVGPSPAAAGAGAGVVSPIAAATQQADGAVAGRERHAVATVVPPRAPAVALRIWAAVASMLVLAWVASVVQTSRWVARGRPALPAGTWNRGNPHGRRIRFVFLSDPGAPFTWGVLRPVIVLPPEARDWEAGRRSMVLEHEWAHVARHDVLWSHLARLTRAVFWFDPLVWWLSRTVDEEAERCCDRRVLDAGHAPSDYVLELVALLRAAPTRARAGSAIARSFLVRRVRSILHSRRDDGLWAGRALWTTVLATGLALGIVDPVLAGNALLATPQASITGCLYRSGTHVNRWYHAEDGLRWQVAWAGPGCHVTFEANETGARAVRPLDLAPLSGDGFIRVEVQGPRPFAQTWRAGTTDHLEWLRGFLAELDAHTGYAADARVSAALDRDGPEGVFALARAAQGDHAAALYLRALIEQTRLNRSQLLRLLALTETHVDNDAELSRLLTAVADRHELQDPLLRRAWHRAAAHLRSRAARQSVAVIVVTDAAR